MIPKKITFKELKFENQYYLAGHYNFIFYVTYDDNDSEQVIKRRYNEIRSLYKTLLLKTPGCRIPNIPAKSIKLKINYANETEVAERKEGVMMFLNYIVEHKILRKNKYVIKFFAPGEKGFSIQNNEENVRESGGKDVFDDIFDSNIMNIKNEGNDKKEEKNENNLDEDDIEPLEDFVQEYNNKKKGVVSKGKDVIGNVYNYIKGYATSSNNKGGEGEDDNNNNENASNIFNKQLTNEDYEYVKKNYKELGEDLDINDYDNIISRLNEGVKMILEKLEKISETRKKSLKALKEIINKDKELKSLDKNKNITDDEEDKKEDVSEANHKRFIKKINKYYTIQIGFIDTNVSETITKLKKYKDLLQDLLDIYSRKNEHINFLKRLHSQKNEFEKQKESNKIKANPMDKLKIEEFEKKLTYEKKFIKKLNKDMKYEIELFKKNNRKDIYNYVNEIYKEKAKKVKDSVEYLNKIKLEDEEDVKNQNSNINNEKGNDYFDNNNDADF